MYMNTVLQMRFNCDGKIRESAKTRFPTKHIRNKYHILLRAIQLFKC